MQKTVFITGASQGLGLELSRYFSNHGYFVYAGCFSKDAELFGPGKVMRGDVSDEADVRRMFVEIQHLDVLINNARFDPSKRKAGTSESAWWDMNLSVSLKGTFLCCVAALELMKKQKAGAIINVSSIRAVIPNDWNRIPYGAAKAGQVSLTRSFAKEAGSYNVRVNAFLPGAIATENLMARITPERSEEVCREIPLRRIGSMEEMCHAVWFLAENTYMTGACLNCSGGLLIDA
ncbi:MAG: SDR family oxidoreductase [Kiritimatiellia bacterium]|jgi:3-oxoacyl-[acyl-carrier protein] reductase